MLEAWERGTRQGDLDRMLTMLAVACPEATSDQLADLSVPERNLQLLRLRQMSFGPTLNGYLPCASCTTHLEFSVPVQPIIERLRKHDPGRPVRWTEGPRMFSLRPVNSRDLMAASREADVQSARRVLLEACLSVICADGTADRVETVVEDSAARVLEQFDRLHLGAEIVCELRCPECANIEGVDLDIGRFLWSEVRHSAISLLREVHELATAYGWREAEILALSSQRRDMYLDMVRE